MSILTRKIKDVEISAIGYGTMGIGGMAYGEAADDEERFKVLDRLYEIGCRNWDTADIYGDAEDLIGKWFKRTGKRNDIFLATKFSFFKDKDSQLTLRGDPEYVKQAAAASLKRLQTDHIDLLYQHRPDPKTPIELTVGAMAELVAEGKVKWLGLSEASPKTIRRAYKVHPIAAIQVEYSPFALEPEQPGGIIDTARELGIAIVAYSPTGRGLITGRYKSPDDFPPEDFRRHIPRYSRENFRHVLALVEVFKRITESRPGTTPAQISIAWLLAQGNDIIPIPGSKQLNYVEENWDSIHIKLSEAELKELRDSIKNVEAHLGPEARYPEGLISQLYADTPELKE
ncbi:Aldo/keto reductase [Cantharellus anzutake]|uniref:Aldo/keto reductase n=1 Tax=Cantharellus anzutake TaxID=1750568 RepID=UPI0019038ECC|nr:Aldo/keto reductase [Cantharellus anzutake]XP_038918632.1 Aldo/keto reductase [Cantharellus anzutake]KAF8315794.1 Aldo/keto reductase [Cantharellus anzutake]KAF8335409.1 Aldo/keto reductase [Cantharellus anzutake]